MLSVTVTLSGVFEKFGDINGGTIPENSVCKQPNAIPPSTRIGGGGDFTQFCQMSS